MTAAAQVRRFYETLHRAWGRQHWWPARTRFEVIAGAILTQNTAWTNVERALRQLRRAGRLNLAGVRRTPEPALAELIRSSGYFRQKARRLKNFIEFLDTRYGGSLNRMFARPTPQLREELLALNGVGPETADSILLYAGNHPVFVVDAYTRRIVERHGMLPPTAKYEEIRKLFERALRKLPTGRQSPAHAAEVGMQIVSSELAAAGGTIGGAQASDPLGGPVGSCHRPSPMSTCTREPLAQIYNEMHALIVGVGKNYCLKQKPRCAECPLGRFLPPR